MRDVLLPAVILVTILLVSILTLAVANRCLRSSRRSESLNEDRYELLRDQWARLEFLREERKMLIDELERQSRERQQLTAFLGKTPPQLVEVLKRERTEHLEAQERIEDLEQELQRLEEQLERERQGHLESQRRVEQLERQQKEQSGTRQEVERLSQERHRLAEDLEREREVRLGAQRRIEQQEQERAHLQREFRRLKAELDSRSGAPIPDRVKEADGSRPWWRKPALVVGLLFGGLLLWLTSLVVGLSLVPS
jgi:chromosome segregation ATPase